jgi:hypothetical protein
VGSISSVVDDDDESEEAMTTALARYTSPAQLSIQEMASVGDLFYQSGLFADIRGAAQATTKIIAGQELGIPPFAAMNGFHIIKGKAAMGANLIGATIKRSGKYDYIVREMTPERCLIEFYQVIDGKRESIGKSDFTVADAKKAGTQNLDRFPRNMLFARAMSNGARWFTPDVFLGPIYTPEELGAVVDEAGDVVPGSSYVPPLQLPEAQPVEQVQAEPAPGGIEELATSVKAMRECERTVGDEPPAFVWNRKQGRAALQLEHDNSRDRLYTWLSTKVEAAPALDELDDAALMDLVYAAAGL